MVGSTLRHRERGTHPPDSSALTQWHQRVSEGITNNSRVICPSERETPPRAVETPVSYIHGAVHNHSTNTHQAYMNTTLRACCPGGCGLSKLSVRVLSYSGRTKQRQSVPNPTYLLTYLPGDVFRKYNRLASTERSRSVSDARPHPPPSRVSIVPSCTEQNKTSRILLRAS